VFLRIYENLDQRAQISRLLIKNDIDLYEMHHSTDNLEDYFIKLTGGSANV